MPVRLPASSAFIGADEAEVGPQRRLEDVLLAVDRAALFAVGDHRVHADRREERRDARGAGAQTLREDALRRRLELQRRRSRIWSSVELARR